VLCERERRPDLASEHYYEALRVDPGFAPARNNLAHLLYDGGLYEEALTQFKRLIEVAPGDPHAQAGLAATLLHLERVDEAATVVNDALIAAPGDAELSVLAARLEIRRGAFAAAISRLSPLATGRTDIAVNALAWIAAAELARGRTREAVGAAQRALSLAPDDALASYALGVSLKKLRDPSAKHWLARARALSPGLEMSLNSLE
jgi:Flp pilus assembly protein TadD